MKIEIAFERFVSGRRSGDLRFFADESLLWPLWSYLLLRQRMHASTVSASRVLALLDPLKLKIYTK